MGMCPFLIRSRPMIVWAQNLFSCIVNRTSNKHLSCQSIFIVGIIESQLPSPKLNMSIVWKWKWRCLHYCACRPQVKTLHPITARKKSCGPVVSVQRQCHHAVKVPRMEARMHTTFFFCGCKKFDSLCTWRKQRNWEFQVNWEPSNLFSILQRSQLEFHLPLASMAVGGTGIVQSTCGSTSRLLRCSRNLSLTRGTWLLARRALHSPFPTSHSTFQTLHRSSMSIPHITLHPPWRCMLHTPHFTPRPLTPPASLSTHSTESTHSKHFTHFAHSKRSRHFTLFNVHASRHTTPPLLPHFTLHPLHPICSTPHTLHSALSHSTLHTLHIPDIPHNPHIPHIPQPTSSTHCTLYAQNSTSYTPHFSLLTSPFKLSITLKTSHCTLQAPRLTLDSLPLQSTLYTSHPKAKFFAPLFTFHTLDSSLSTLYTPHFTLHTLHSTLYAPHFTLKTPPFPLHTLHSTPAQTTPHMPHSTICTAHSTLHTFHPTLHVRHCTLCTSHLTVHTPRCPPHT